jgi:hypothetical protein
MPGEPLFQGDPLREIDYSIPYMEVPYVPDVTKSQNVWFVEECGEFDAPLLQALEKARVDLGFDPYEDILWRKGSDAVEHAKVVLALYASLAGGNPTSVSEDLLSQLGGAEATIEWRTVGAPTFREVRFLPGAVYMTQSFEMRISGFQVESKVFDGKTYACKVPIQTGWVPVVPHMFQVLVSERRISLGD